MCSESYFVFVRLFVANRCYVVGLLGCFVPLLCCWVITVFGAISIGLVVGARLLGFGVSTTSS